MRSHTILLTLTLTAGLAAAAYRPLFAEEPAAAKPTKPKNLKILPRNIAPDDLKGVMKSFEKALGVECAFCHDTNDFSKDTNKHKGIARDMMKATTAFNKQVFKGKPDVTCETCHRGQKEPKL